MDLVKKNQTLFGTESQINMVKVIIEQFDTIKATILKHKIILPNTTPEDKREFHHYDLELIAPSQDLKKYFEILKDNKDVLFKETKKYFDYEGYK